MSPGTRRSIVIVGGGASGVLLALHLLRDRTADLDIRLVEPRPLLGRGIAYSTRCDEHLLNVPAGNMSAYADDRDHFWRWLAARNLVAGADRFVFVPRRHFGDYLGAALTAEVDRRLTIVTGTVIALVPTATGLELRLDSGVTLAADRVVLATGHDMQPRADSQLVRPGSVDDTPLAPDAPVMILGSGLSMVDAWLSLEAAGHRGPVEIVSRRGLLPLRHAPPQPTPTIQIPVGADLRTLTRWLRETIEPQPDHWRSVVDALRPVSQQIWQHWDEASRRAFLAHVRPYWNVHRHRLPPPLHDRLHAALASGRLRLSAGRLLAVRRDGASLHVELQSRDHGRQARKIARLYDCTGLATDIEQGSNPLLRTLVVAGLARPDPLRIGIDVTADCKLVGRDRAASDRLFAIGPPTRGRFFEIEAIPDIRVQAAALAGRLVAGLAETPAARAATR